MALENLPLEEYTPDVEEYWDRIFTGPHGELLQMIDDFNRLYYLENDGIGLTKKLQWKRGSYDKVKAAIMERALLMSKRPRGMDSIFKNIDNGQWSLNRMKEKLNVIQDKIYRLKWQGTTLDTDLAKNAFNTKIDILSKALTVANKITPDIEFGCYVRQGIDGLQDIRGDRITINISITNNKLTVYYKTHEQDENGNCDILTEHIIQEFKCGDIQFKLEIPAFNWINRPDSWQIRVTYHAQDGLVKHPYISKTFPTVASNGYGYCFGDLHSPIINAIKRGDLASLGALLREWISGYSADHTNPLNCPTKWFFGMPENLNKGFKSRFAKNMNECSTLMSEIIGAKIADEWLDNPDNGNLSYENVSRAITSIVTDFEYHRELKSSVNYIYANDTGYNYNNYSDDIKESIRVPAIEDYANRAFSICNDIKCTLRDTCFYHYKFKTIAKQLTTNEDYLEQKVSFKADQLKPKVDKIADFWWDNIRDKKDVPKEVRAEWDDIYYCIADTFRDDEQDSENLNWENIRRFIQRALIPLSNYNVNDSGNALKQYKILMKYVDKGEKYLKNPDFIKDMKVIKPEKDDSTTFDNEYLESAIPGWRHLDDESKGKALAALTNSSNLPF